MKRFSTLIHVCCLSMLLAACDNRGTALLNGLHEDEANMIITTLAKSGIAASKTVAADGASNIYVAGADQSEALSRLHDRGLPRQSYVSLGDIFKKDGIISTPLEEKARFIYALAQELEKTLSQLDDVVYVRVHPVLARKASLSGPAANASAGVLIKHRPDVDLTPLIPQIQELVAHSIPDLQPDKVSIIMAVSEERGPMDTSIGERAATTPVQSGLWLTLAGIFSMLAVGAVYALRHFRSRSQRAVIQIQPEAIELHD